MPHNTQRFTEFPAALLTLPVFFTYGFFAGKRLFLELDLSPRLTGLVLNFPKAPPPCGLADRGVKLLEVFPVRLRGLNSRLGIFAVDPTAGVKLVSVFDL
jgi:hypothetical protein